MKKSEFKKLIKPLVHECIKESLMEDGMIAGIIAEVVRGMTATQATPEAPPQREDPQMTRMQNNALKEQASSQLQEHREKLMAAIGGEAYNNVNLFEGTTPVPAQQSPTQQAAALSGQAPNDPGVDIGNIFGSVGANWGAHMNDIKKESR